MNNGKGQSVSPGGVRLCVQPGIRALLGIVLFSLSIILIPFAVYAQTEVNTTPFSRPTHFRIGEKLTYYVSFAKFENAAFAELYVASSGKLSGIDGIEIHSKIKTFDMVSAAFFLVDESRVVYASAETGLPLYVTRIVNDGLIPKESVTSYLAAPTSNFDILTLIYKAREMGGDGSFSMVDGGHTYNVTFRPDGNEKVKTPAGEFMTTVSMVESDYLTARGITELKINFSIDDDRMPVLFRGKTARSDFRAALASIEIDLPVSQPVSTPTPSLSPTPRPAASPRPTPAPVKYFDNRPLLPELGFALGETLNYRVTTSGKPVATISLKAAERKLIQKVDSLLLSANVNGIDQDNRIFALGDSITVRVNPDTLAPFASEAKFGPLLANLNQTVKFDPKTGFISFPGTDPFDAPVGTHTLLSLIYAMRSFNLRPSKDPGNPVNDTRVAVFWESKAYIFTLRPANPETITVNGEKILAQLISINTGNAQLDALAPKVWLTMDAARVPLRFSIGPYQADLISQTIDIPK